MVAQSVMLQAADAAFTASGSKATESGASGRASKSSSGFELLMGREIGNLRSRLDSSGGFHRISASKAAANKVNSSKTANKTGAFKAAGKISSYRSAEKISSYKAADKGKVSAADNEDSTNDVKGTGPKGEDAAGIDVSDISAVLMAVQEVVREVLNLSQEEFSKLLSDTGITQADLADPDKLKQLFLVCNGNADPLQLLTDEELNLGLNNLLVTVENTVEASDTGLSLEQLGQILSEVMQRSDRTGAYTEDETGLTADMEADLTDKVYGQALPGSEGEAADISGRSDFRTDNNMLKARGAYSGDAYNTAQDTGALDAQDLKEGVPAGVTDGDDAVMKADVDNKTSLGEAAEDSKEMQDDGTTTDLSFKPLDADIAPEGEKRSSQKEMTDKDAGRQASQDSFVPAQEGLLDRLREAGMFRAEYVPETNDAMRLKEIVNQIVNQIRLTVSQNNASLQMALHPEGLGKLRLTVEAKEGIMTARFVVSNETAKEAIEANIQVLKDTLSGQGLKVEDIEVTVSANGFDQESGPGKEGQAAEQKRSRGHKFEAVGNEMSAAEFDVNVGEDNIAMTLGSNIDMTA